MAKTIDLCKFSKAERKLTNQHQFNQLTGDSHERLTWCPQQHTRMCWFWTPQDLCDVALIEPQDLKTWWEIFCVGWSDDADYSPYLRALVGRPDCRMMWARAGFLPCWKGIMGRLMAFATKSLLINQVVPVCESESALSGVNLNSDANAGKVFKKAKATPGKWGLLVLEPTLWGENGCTKKDERERQRKATGMIFPVLRDWRVPWEGYRNFHLRRFYTKGDVWPLASF